MPFPVNVMLMCAWFIGVSVTALVRSCKTGCSERSIPGEVVLLVLLPIIVIVVDGAAVCACTAFNGTAADTIRLNMFIVITIVIVFVGVLIVIYLSSSLIS